MADKKISELIETTSLNASDVTAVVNGGVTKKVRVDNLIVTGTASLTPITSNIEPETDNIPVQRLNNIPARISVQNLLPNFVSTPTIDLNLGSTSTLPRNLIVSVKNASLSAQHFSDQSVGAAAIVDGSITVSKIDPNAKIGGATGGGTDRFIYENDQVVNTNYTITAGKNAMSAGPITINNGVTITVPNGSTYTIV